MNPLFTASKAINWIHVAGLITEIDLFNFLNSFFVRLFFFFLILLGVLLSTSTCFTHMIYSVSYLDTLSSIIPFIILLYIIQPVFLLLYQLELIKFPTTNLETLGNQWYWSYWIQLEDWWWCFDNPRAHFEYLFSRMDSVVAEPIVKGDFNFSQSILPTVSYSISSSYLFSVNNLLLLPLFETINTIVTSVDVIHCWSIYSLGTKIDAIPGRLNLAFTLRLFCRGLNRGFCYELCGQGHYGMQIIAFFLPRQLQEYFINPLSTFDLVPFCFPSIFESEYLYYYLYNFYCRIRPSSFGFSLFR